MPQVARPISEIASYHAHIYYDPASTRGEAERRHPQPPAQGRGRVVTWIEPGEHAVQPDAGERFAQPGARISYLPQEQEPGGFATTLAYVEAGFDADAGDRHRALYLLKELGLSGEENLGALSGGEARRTALSAFQGEVVAVRPRSPEEGEKP